MTSSKHLRSFMLLGAAGLAALASGCDSGSSSNPASRTLRVTIVQAALSIGDAPVEVEVGQTPVSAAQVRVRDGARVREAVSGVDGQAQVRVTSPTVDVLVRPSEAATATAVLGVSGDALRVPLGTPPQTAPQTPAQRLTSQTTTIQGFVQQWVPSGFGERSEARFRFRHVDGLIPDVAPAGQDLAARSGLEVGSDETVCECLDPEVTDPVLCPEDQILCRDPNPGEGVTSVSFAVPPGTIELGYVERVTDAAADGRFLAFGSIFYEPALAVPAATNLLDVEFAPDVLAQGDACPRNQNLSLLQGTMALRLNGIDRAFVNPAQNGRVRLSLDLVSPFGLALPVVIREPWPREQVRPLDRDQQLIALQFPFALEGMLSDFSYGYAVAATTLTQAGDGTVYRQEVRAARRRDVVDFCVVDVATPVFATTFTAPTAVTALAADGAQKLVWRGPQAPLRRIAVVDASGQERVSVWLLDPKRNMITLTNDLLAAPLPAGAYELRYEVLAPPFSAENSNLLVAPDVWGARHTGTYYRQVHAFIVDGS